MKLNGSENGMLVFAVRAVRSVSSSSMLLAKAVTSSHSAVTALRRFTCSCSS